MTSPITIDGIGITLRTFTEADRAFVKDSWIRSAGSVVRNTQKPRFFEWFRPLVDQHVSLDLIRIACTDDDPNTIVGWSAVRNGVPIYAYTAREFRGFGLGKHLRGTP